MNPSKKESRNGSKNVSDEKSKKDLTSEFDFEQETADKEEAKINSAKKETKGRSSGHIIN